MSASNEAPRRRGPRRWGAALLAAAGVAGLAVGMEALIVSAISLFHHLFGAWGGLAVFTLVWLLGGVAGLLITMRVWPARATIADLHRRGRLGRGIAWIAERGRIPAALAVAWFFGPLTGPPLFRALGYQGRALIGWTLASPALFCPFWYAWTIGGFDLVKLIRLRWT